MTVQKRIDAVAADISRRDVLKGAGGITCAIVLSASGVALTGAARARGDDDIDLVLLEDAPVNAENETAK